MECPALTNEEEWADLYDSSPPHPLRLEGEDRWEAKIHTPVPVTWHSKHQLASETNSQKPRGIGKTKKRKDKTISDPLTQTNTRHIKPESVNHCKKKKIGKKGKKGEKEFYQLFDKESGVAHNFTEGTAKWTCDLFLVYLWEAAMQPVPVVQCWSRV